VTLASVLAVVSCAGRGLLQAVRRRHVGPAHLHYSFVSVLLLTLFFFLWTAATSIRREDSASFTFGGYGSSEASFVYPSLADSLLARRLSLPFEPRPEVLKAADPYVGGVFTPGLGDLSLYNGRYYAYFGVVPAVVFFAPFRLLMRVSAPQNLAVALFAFGAAFFFGSRFSRLCFGTFDFELAFLRGFSAGSISRCATCSLFCCGDLPCMKWR
jgi:hypothetical protein